MLNPRVDFAFKKLFGAKENKDILISFINAIVSKEDRVKDVVLLNPYNNKNHQHDKLSRLDIKATDEQGRHYNIEMQITDQLFYNQRILSYWSKLYTSQLQQGYLFANLKKTISINVLNFNYLENEPAYHNVFKILNVKSRKSYFEDFELHVIELEKFHTDIQHIKTTLDRWASFLKRAHRNDKDILPKELTKEPAIEKAFLTLNTLSLDKDEREIYEARLKWLRDEEATLIKAHEKGHQAGVEQGIEHGATQRNREIAVKSFAEGVPIELIAKITGLSEQKINALKDTKE